MKMMGFVMMKNRVDLIKHLPAPAAPAATPPPPEAAMSRSISEAASSRSWAWTAMAPRQTARRIS